METRTVLIALGGQKGGAGKTLLTTLLASYINEKTDYSVKVIDADDKQLSIYSKRQTEISNDEIPKGHKPYDIGVYQSSEVGQKLQAADIGIYDFIIVDFPGTLSQQGVTGAYRLLDLIFVPLNIISDVDVMSTIGFCSLLNKNVDPVREKAGFDPAEKFFIFNKINPSVREFKNAEMSKQLKEETPYPTLENALPSWKFFQDHWQTYKYPELENPKHQKITDAMVSEMFEKAEKIFKENNE